MGWRAGLGRASGAEPPSLRSSGAHSAALPESGIQGRSRDDALSSCPHPGQHPAARERSPEESMRGQELPGGSSVLLALSQEPRREIQCGRRSILASFSLSVTFLLRIGRGRPAVPGADGSRSGAGASACGSFSRVVVFCRIVFPGRRCTLTAIPVPFRREEKFRCQISPSSLFLPLWTGCLTRRCARS